MRLPRAHLAVRPERPRRLVSDGSRVTRPRWAYVFWTESPTLRALVSAVSARRQSRQESESRRYGTVRAACIRLGGLYVDFQCLRPFDDLHRENELFLSSEPLVHTIQLEKSNAAALCNTLMASAPGHPFWLRVLDNIKDTFNRERLKSDAATFNSEESDITVPEVPQEQNPRDAPLAMHVVPRCSSGRVRPSCQTSHQSHHLLSVQTCQLKSIPPKGIT
ncbi:hypothetical protein DVH05_010119 [Phytophthora capsici]|nr:hypothetical protein DVH05_006379 [Phytophthora capsici]KAG1702330.1 hypothetical protein DVH05_010119 [Phytophthora capsici]